MTGNLNVYTNVNYYNGIISNISISNIAFLNGSVLLSPVSSAIGSVSLSAASSQNFSISGWCNVSATSAVGAVILNRLVGIKSVNVISSGTAVVGLVSVSGPSQSAHMPTASLSLLTTTTGSILNVHLSNILTWGAINVTNTQGTVQNVVINGTNRNPLTIGPINFASATSTVSPTFVLGAVANITGYINITGSGLHNGPNTVIINAPVGVGVAPPLMIHGDVIIGSPLVPTLANPGPILFDQLVSIKGKTTVTLSNTKGYGNITFQGYVSYFTMAAKFTLIQQSATQSQSVLLSNLTQLLGTNETQSFINYFDAYKTSPVNAYTGSLIVNNRSLPSIDSIAFTSQSSLSFPNDLNCINACKGRGMIPVGGSSCGAVCDCFGGWQGSDCTIPNPCTINKTCDCACSQWSSWAVVAEGQSGQARTRECSRMPPSGLYCDISGILGSVVCIAGQYEATPGTNVTFRSCLWISNCSATTQYESKAFTGTSDRVCTNLRNCTDLEYESTAPTRTSNRVCSLLSLCNLTYQYSMPLSGTSDRVCATIRNCTSSEFQTAAPTPTSNRGCLSIRACNPLLEYQTAAPTATSDRICTNLTVCDYSTQYQSVEPTTTTNRACAPLAPACNFTAQQYQAVAPTNTNNRVCRSISICLPSQYEKAAPTPTSDRDCLAITDCLGDQFETVGPTLTSDRLCNKTTICGTGQVIFQQPTTTSDRICAPDFCAATPCLNGGLCFNEMLAPTCVCASGFNGTYCEIKIVNPCDPSPCKSGGTCYAQSSSFACLCPSGFTGSTCQTVVTSISPCATFTCKNGGACYSPTSTSAACACATGFTGTNCESVVKNPCSGVTCQHNGKCLTTTANANGFVCSCTTDYIGTYCQDPKNICKSAPCKSNATCTALAGGDFSCACPARSGWYGKDCSLSKCKPSPCLNDGVCFTNSSSYFNCTCPLGFAGTICESIACIPDFCRNGGNCSVVDQLRVCTCPPGFFGEFCEEERVTTTVAAAVLEASTSTISTPVAGGAAAAACIILGVIVVFAIRAKKRKFNSFPRC
jgi:hypothetical protein